MQTAAVQTYDLLAGGLCLQYLWAAELEQPSWEVPNPDAPLVTFRFQTYRALEDFFILNVPIMTKQELRTKVIGLALLVFKKPGG